MSVQARRRMWTWLVGSVAVGTLAVLFTFDRDYVLVRPLDRLSPVSVLGVIGMLIALFAALGLLAWGMLDTSWLPADVRAGVLWVVVVGGGGLPFALVAAMRLRPPRANLLWQLLGPTAL